MNQAIRMSRFGSLLLTRDRGRRVASKLPRRKEVVLDFRGVEAASPSFLDELLRQSVQRGADSVVILNASERTQETLTRLRGLERGPIADEELELQVS